jgi:hypothetical protein
MATRPPRAPALQAQAPLPASWVAAEASVAAGLTQAERARPRESPPAVAPPRLTLILPAQPLPSRPPQPPHQAASSPPRKHAAMTSCSELKTRATLRRERLAGAVGGLLRRRRVAAVNDTVRAPPVRLQMSEQRNTRQRRPPHDDALMEDP